MTMDTDTLEMLIDNVRSLWARPLDDYEEDMWRRMLKPDNAPSLDADFVAQTLLAMSTRPQFEHARPDIVAFRGHYDHLVDLSKPPEPEPGEKPSTTEQCIQHLDEVRALLVAERDGASSEGPKQEAGQLL